MNADQVELMSRRLDKDRWWPAARRKILAHVLRTELPPADGREILEAGSGPGWNLEMLQEFGAVVGLEPDLRFHDFAQQNNPGVEILQSPIPAPLHRSFDLICILDVMEHLENEQEAVSWLSSHLKPEGRLLLTVPAFPILWGEHDLRSHHFRRYRKKSLRAVLEKKFEIETLTYFNFFLFPWALIGALLYRSITRNPRAPALKGSSVEKCVNPVLKNLFGLERFLIPTVPLPFGVSLLVIAKKHTGTG